MGTSDNKSDKYKPFIEPGEFIALTILALIIFYLIEKHFPTFNRYLDGLFMIYFIYVIIPADNPVKKQVRSMIKPVTDQIDDLIKKYIPHRKS